jgi:hypothetical protein
MSKAPQTVPCQVCKVIYDGILWFGDEGYGIIQSPTPVMPTPDTHIGRKLIEVVQDRKDLRKVSHLYLVNAIADINSGT